MNLNDLQIVKNIKKGDTKTYEYIVEKYSKQMYYLAYNILHINCTKEDIEECVSDAFLEAWLNIDKFDFKRGAFKTWLFILTKYKALEYKRKLGNQKVINIDELSIEDNLDIEKQLINREEQEKVIDVINGFNDVDKELFIRRYFYNEKINDIAEALNLTRSAIDNRLLRGRNRIKEVFSYE